MSINRSMVGEMRTDLPSRPPNDAPTGSQPWTGSTATSRRSFLKGVGQKALYAPPIFLALSASEAYAGSGADFDSTCGDVGSPCTTDSYCCGGDCLPTMSCCAQTMDTCAMDNDCCPGLMCSGSMCV